MQMWQEGNSQEPAEAAPSSSGLGYDDGVGGGCQRCQANQKMKFSAVGNVYWLLALRETTPTTKRAKRRLWRGAASSNECCGPGYQGNDPKSALPLWVEADTLRHCSARYCPLQPAPRSTIAAAFSTDGSTLASTHGDHTVKIICCRTGQCLKILTGHRRTPWVVRYHPKLPSVLASGSLDHEVRLWDASTAECIASHDFYRPIASLAFHASGDLLAVASGHKLHIWQYGKEGEASQPSIVLRTRRSLRAVHFHPQGAPLLLTAEVNGLDSNDSPPTIATAGGYVNYPLPSIHFTSTAATAASASATAAAEAAAANPNVPQPNAFTNWVWPGLANGVAGAAVAGNLEGAGEFLSRGGGMAGDMQNGAGAYIAHRDEPAGTASPGGFSGVRDLATPQPIVREQRGGARELGEPFDGSSAVPMDLSPRPSSFAGEHLFERLRRQDAEDLSNSRAEGPAVRSRGGGRGFFGRPTSSPVTTDGAAAELEADFPEGPLPRAPTIVIPSSSTSALASRYGGPLGPGFGMGSQAAASGTAEAEAELTLGPMDALEAGPGNDGDMSPLEAAAAAGQALAGHAGRQSPNVVGGIWEFGGLEVSQTADANIAAVNLQMAAGALHAPLPRTPVRSATFSGDLGGGATSRGVGLWPSGPSGGLGLPWESERGGGFRAHPGMGLGEDPGAMSGLEAGLVQQLQQMLPTGDYAGWELPFLQGWVQGQAQAGLQHLAGQGQDDAQLPGGIPGMAFGTPIDMPGAFPSAWEGRAGDAGPGGGVQRGVYNEAGENSAAAEREGGGASSGMPPQNTAMSMASVAMAAAVAAARAAARAGAGMVGAAGAGLGAGIGAQIGAGAALGAAAGITAGMRFGQPIGAASPTRLPPAPAGSIQDHVGQEQTAAQATLAAAAAGELPCTVKLRIWPHDMSRPKATLNPDTCRLTIPHAVLCSEMGAHFSPCGRFLAACVACVPSSEPEGASARQATGGDVPAANAASPTQHDTVARHVIYELRVYSLEENTFGQVLASRTVRAAHCLTSIQFSPSSSHILLAYGRRHNSLLRKLVADGTNIVPVYTILEVFRVSDMALVRVLPSAEDEVNVACFHPKVGGGLVYGTKEGKLRILRHDRVPRRHTTGRGFEDELLEAETSEASDLGLPIDRDVSL